MRRLRSFPKHVALGLLAAGLLLAGNFAARARRRFGRSVGPLFRSTPIDVGLDQGISPNHVNSLMFATKSAIEKHPEELRAFLAAGFETVAFMRKNKAEVVRITAAVLRMSAAILGRAYDETVRVLSADGRFDMTGLKVLSRSFVEMNLLGEEPDVAKLYTENFLPVISR